MLDVHLKSGRSVGVRVGIRGQVCVIEYHGIATYNKSWYIYYSL